MWAYVIVIFFACISFALSPPVRSFKHDTQDMAVFASNFIRYQNGAVAFFADNPGTTGVIPDGSLDLMPGYNAMGSWQNQVSGGILYIYVEDGQRMVHQVVKQLCNTRRVGLNRAGRLLSPLYGDLGLALPAFIPEGSLIAISS